MKLSSLFPLTLVPFAAADWQYRSRPDLAPPKLNITIPPTDEVAPGYYFITPFSGFSDIGLDKGPRQAAPYIYDSHGELVWSGFTYFSIWAVNFQATKLFGKDVLFSFEGSHNPSFGHGHGHFTFLDQNYETIKEVRAGNHKLADKHEFHVLNEKTALIEIYDPISTDLTSYGGAPDQQWIINAIFQEIDLETGKVLFEWSSIDHVSPKDSALPLKLGQIGLGQNSSNAWDYFHINSIDKDENGDYIVSARHAASLYKISGKTGEIIWKIGGLPGVTSSDFTFDKNVTFSFQHHARFLSTSKDGKKQIISFFDNSAQGTENKDGHEVHKNKHSSGKIIEVDTENWVVKLLYVANPPEQLLAKSQGSTQVLDNGNVVVGWGSEGAFTEFNTKAEPIFHAHLDSGSLGERIESYRAFKFDWHGTPNEDIAILSEIEDENTTVYVSWNGDTETKTWRFFEISSDGEKVLLGEKAKSGFETKFVAKNTNIDEVVVESYDSKDNLLASSSVARSQAQVLPPWKHKPVREAFRLQNYFQWKSSR